MAQLRHSLDGGQRGSHDSHGNDPHEVESQRFGWRFLTRKRRDTSYLQDDQVADKATKKKSTWTMGILDDPNNDEVPGSVLLLPDASQYNEPLGMRNAPARTSASSFPQSPISRQHSHSSSRHGRGWNFRSSPKKKTTPDGKIVLEPQPDDSANDPLNWSMWRRDTALLSLGFYCMVGGGMTPILAAGFENVADDFGVSVPRVALTTGLYMMGLGLGSVVLSPTAILYGKRPVYLIAAICFVLSGVWCASSHSFVSLLCARIFQGFAVSSVECLPSATVAEIYFLHEKAYRLGIYTLLLLGGKNLVPLVSAAIIESLGWRWVFWIVAIIVGFGFVLLFFFVPETFWDRSPVPRARIATRFRSLSPVHNRRRAQDRDAVVEDQIHVHQVSTESPTTDTRLARRAHFDTSSSDDEKSIKNVNPIADNQNNSAEGNSSERLDTKPEDLEAGEKHSLPSTPADFTNEHDPRNAYTKYFSSRPQKTYLQSLRPWSGRMSHDKWLKAACRPFILFAYPAILWSSLVYSLSIGWLIVLSESISVIYISRDTYNFTSLQAGLVYISPFVGGILGTAVAGKLSDIVVRYMARRNGGVYEPEFRLVMGIPIAIFTSIGLMGYGWSAQERDSWIVPTIFFGFISFGCSLGSTTSITFAVDSYRQYAGEALVTLNFSKNILHGLVFSLFFNHWLEAQGSKLVFVAIGIIQLGCLTSTIPMYIFGKRARMWTVKKNFMEKF